MYFEKCKFSRKAVPCVKVCIQNLLDQVSYLPRSSCIALVKLQTNAKESQKEKVKNLQKSFSEQPKPLNPIQPKKQFSPIKSLQRSQKKYLRVWSNLLQQSPFEKSLKVEQKYPYFRTDRKPKVPYGIKNFSDLSDT